MSLWQHHNKSPLPKKWVWSESICVACLNSNHNLREQVCWSHDHLRCYLAKDAHSRQGTVVALLGCQPPGWGNITVVGKLPGKVLPWKPSTGSCCDPNDQSMERLHSLPTLAVRVCDSKLQNSQTRRIETTYPCASLWRSCWGWCTTCNRHISGNLVEWAHAWFPDQSMSTCPR